MKTREIAEFVDGELRGDGEIEITSAAGLNSAGTEQITFIEKDTGDLRTAAACLIVPPHFDAASMPQSTLISVRNPRLAFALIASRLHPAKNRHPEVHATAVISESASIGVNIFLGAFVSVGDNSTVGDGSHVRAGSKIGDRVTIGQNCMIHPNVFIEDGCWIGNNVVLHSGAVIGAEGFGYVKDESGEYHKFPQIGTVVIEDNVEIGANSCVDRGALGETRIASGTKLDNLVHVGHNVKIGSRCVIAAQTGISGSTIIEDDCVIGGQVGFGDHARVKSGAIIGSQAGVLPGKIVRPGVWWGTPVQPLDEYKRQNAHAKSIGRLKEEVKALKIKLQESSGKTES
ncbi:MAG: UDP-3-O-(3-hydroxymyristoyl)glucosamine N-acyltransferase [Pyrinomonadaceae bacterium]